MFDNPIMPIALVAAFLLSLSIHEAAHAFMADQLGDPTARLAGRVTLNPIVHLDPIGTLLPLLLILLRFPIIFGWGKPVPFDPFNLRNPRKDAAIISFSGPAANLILATILSVTIQVVYPYLSSYAAFLQFLAYVVALNVMWAIFNLIPIHPLDGGKVLVGLLPREQAFKVDALLNQYGLILLIFLIFPFFGTSPIIAIISPIINFILSLLIPGTPLV